MKYRTTILHLLICLISIPTVYALDDIDELFQGTWNGVEVMGGDHHTTNLIKGLIPIEIGSPFEPNTEKFKLWCDDVKHKTKQNVSCSIIGYIEGKYYFNVEISKNEAGIKNFRKIPPKAYKKTLPEELNKLYHDWEEKFDSFIKEGAVPKQFFKEGYLQCNNPELQHIAIELFKIAPKYNDMLLDIIRYSHDSDERVKAATLLSWSNHPENINIIINENLLYDPDIDVRNELVRSFSYLINDVKSKKTLKNSISTLCDLVKLPSHSDRTKSLVSLQNIFRKNPELGSFVNKDCKETLTYIREMSILPNVGGVAKDIMVRTNNENTHHN